MDASSFEKSQRTDETVLCDHKHLELEKKRDDYLTGWYICLQCGERVLIR
jgi:hypothetical protein